jgi:hypothetical protein
LWEKTNKNKKKQTLQSLFKGETQLDARVLRRVFENSGELLFVALSSIGKKEKSGRRLSVLQNVEQEQLAVVSDAA